MASRLTAGRRALLGGLSSAAFSTCLACAQSALGVAAQPAVPPPPPAPSPQAPKLDDRVAPEYQRLVIARWGDGVLPSAPAFDPARLTPKAAETQFPYDAVIAALITPPPAQDGIARYVLVTANPTAPARMVFPGGLDNPGIAGRLQGATVQNLQYLGGRWVTVDGGYQSRRISDGTLCQISGPAAARIGSAVQGVLGPGAGCATPWGTVLLAEGDTGAWLQRLAGVGYGYADPVQAPRFGWVTELDALDPFSIPVKHTALGRLNRSGIALGLTPDGRAVVFFSGSGPSGFFYRFISAGNATDGTILDAGTLSAARISGDGVDWVALGTDVAALVGAIGAAADAGASAFDAPGGIAIAPDRSAIYLACAGNPARSAGQTNALNPRAGDDNGHILVFAPPGGDLTAKNFAGQVAIAAGNPASVPGTQYAAGSDAWMRKPRTLDLDAEGQLWIGTDQRGNTVETADGLFIMQTGGPSPYLLDMAYLAPIGAAIGGAAFDSSGGRTVFAAVRHPGATPGASFDAPATRWPTLLPGMPPQTTIIGLVGPS